MKSRKGFTLVELLAVIVILAIIALIATPIILGVIDTARRGSAEASAIIRKIENIPSTRPMTHDLFIDIAEQTKYKITKIEINDVDDQTYFSTIYMYNEQLQNEIQIDSRPSDAIAVALRADVPIYVTTNVLATGLVSTDVEKDEQEAQEFKDFIKDIKPADFDKLIKKNFESDQ